MKWLTDKARLGAIYLLAFGVVAFDSVSRVMSMAGDLILVALILVIMSGLRK